MSATKLTGGFGASITRSAIFVYWGREPRQCLIAFRWGDVSQVRGTVNLTRIGPLHIQHR